MFGAMDHLHMRYLAHTWDQVRRSFADPLHDRPDLYQMREFVEQIAESRYAEVLHPVQSMWTLRLYQTAEYDPVRDPYITIAFDPNAGEFVVEYLAGPYKAPFSTSVVKSHWVKRHTSGFTALERCLNYLNWFT
jgi:hypothetical protein